MIRDLSACLLGQSLRVDCRYENKTSNPLTYEFSLTKDNRKHIIPSRSAPAELLSYFSSEHPSMALGGRGNLFVCKYSAAMFI